MKFFLIIWFLHILQIGEVRAQKELRGMVIDHEGKGIELVNVILLKQPDSIFLQGTITDKDGRFLFRDIREKELLIKLSCIGYQESVLPWSENETHLFVLKALSVKLDEVSVIAERQLVRAIDGKLSFDVTSLIKNRPVANAFDVLGEIPGIEKSGDNLSLIGARSTTVILNGRKTSLTYEQIRDILKASPPESVKNIEVLYAPSPQYGVQGAAINVVMDRKREKKRIGKGEVVFAGKQAYYFSPSAGGIFYLTNENSSFDFSYFFRYDLDNSTEEVEAMHQLWNESYPVSLNNRSKNRYRVHSFRMGYDYDLKNKDMIRIAYNGKYVSPDIFRKGFAGVEEITKINTRKNSSGPSWMQNISADYHHKQWNMGIDYTYYGDKTDQFLFNSGERNEKVTSFACQTIHRGMIYVNHSNTWTEKITLSYGINGNLSFSRDKMKTDRNEERDHAFSQKQSEYSLNVFMGWRQTLGKKISFNASLTYQYYKAAVDVKETLWEKNTFFPNFSLVYKINAGKILQVSFTSEQNYPSYWQITPNVSYLNAYMVAEGNPGLQPSITYSGRLIFLLSNKYVFQLFGNRSKNHIQQLLYQDKEKLQATYRLINLDRHDTFGGLVVIPFKMGEIWSSKLILSGFFINDKGQLEDIDFDIRKWYGRVTFSNNIPLNSSGNLHMQLSGFYATPAIQGIYRIDPLYDLSVGVVWNVNKGLRLTVNGEDLLNGKKLHTSTRIETQNYRQTLYQDTRQVTVSLRYTFGGYKEKKIKKVDTSRFGTD